jgi:hypothetical protein
MNNVEPLNAAQFCSTRGIGFGGIPVLKARGKARD